MPSPEREGFWEGCALAPRTRPLQQVNYTPPTWVEPLQVTLECLRLDPLRRCSFFVTAPYFFSCTKNDTSSLSSSCIDYRFACKLCVRNRINLDPEERLGVSETGVHPWATVYLVTGKFQRTRVIQRYPRWPRASRTSPDEHTRLSPKSLKKKAYNEYSQSANEGLSRELAREKEGETETGQRHQIEHSWVPGARQPEHRFLYFLSLSSFVFYACFSYRTMLLYFLKYGTVCHHILYYTIYSSYTSDKCRL